MAIAEAGHDSSFSARLLTASQRLAHEGNRNIMRTQNKEARHGIAGAGMA